MTDSTRLYLFSGTLFLSAALMFGLQPMIGKMLLPIVGGTPSGWIVAMAFFQVMLLAGYFLAHMLSRFSPRKQAIGYLCCLGIGLFFLPMILSQHAQLAGEPPGATGVFLLLACVVGLPFIALAATASTIQRLFTTTSHASAQDPYFLYAASNLGSFTGLLLYPFLVEPNITLTSQSMGWAVGYGLLIALSVFCTIVSGRNTNFIQKREAQTVTPLSWRQRLEWMALSMLPCALLLAVTAHITTDIISMPMIWVVPLGLYLLTFVIAFSRKPLVPYGWLIKLQPPCAVLAIGVGWLAGPWKLSWTAIVIHLFCFTVIALTCHMRLARLRPANNANVHLTSYYLMISLGGAIGGVLVAFVAPSIFNWLVEYPLLLALSTLLNQEGWRAPFGRIHLRAITLAIIMMVILTLSQIFSLSTPEYVRQAVLVSGLLLISTYSRIAFIAGIITVGCVFVMMSNQPTILMSRNFFGTIHVYEVQIPLGASTVPIRYMRHGTTLHGQQILDSRYETVPTTYYSRQGPLGDAFTALNPRRVATVGLGSGTTNCYSSKNRQMTFFEIDPAVVDLAKKHFTYLSKCGNGQPRIILGDARLELKKLENEKFDMIILDAFSSDTVPTHLLTKEAIELYLQRLAPHGTILFHISNRYFRLDHPIAATGALLGLKGAVKVNSFSTDAPKLLATDSIWMTLTADPKNLTGLLKRGWKETPVPAGLAPWTDDYTNLLKAFGIESFLSRNK